MINSMKSWGCISSYLDNQFYLSLFKIKQVLSYSFLSSNLLPDHRQISTQLTSCSFLKKIKKENQSNKQHALRQQSSNQNQSAQKSMESVLCGIPALEHWACSVWLIPMNTCLQETDFPLPEASRLEMGMFPLPLLQAGILCFPSFCMCCTCLTSLWVHVCSSPVCLEDTVALQLSISESSYNLPASSSAQMSEHWEGTDKDIQFRAQCCKVSLFVQYPIVKFQC